MKTRNSTALEILHFVLWKGYDAAVGWGWALAALQRAHSETIPPFLLFSHKCRDMLFSFPLYKRLVKSDTWGDQ